MHMADALISPAVGGVMAAASVGAIAYSVSKIKKEDTFDEKKVPIMAISGAFVFAAQMINFTIPGTGSSGHIGGGLLLAALIGQYPALIAISAVLLIQCLFFADGGLLALGCNIFNLGVIPCLLAYPLIYKPMIKRGMENWRLMLASILTVVIGLQLGSFFVVLETTASQIAALPFGAFALLMQPIHLAIGLVEGIVTGLILIFVKSMRPEILESANNHTPIGKVSIKKVVLTLVVATVIIGGVLSLFASAFPDGLEWAIGNVAGGDLEGTGSIFSTIQDKLSFMPDYATKADPEKGTSIAGVIGSILMIAALAFVGVIISVIKKKKKEV